MSDQTEKQRRDHIETLALFARIVLMIPPELDVRRVFFVLSL